MKKLLSIVLIIAISCANTNAISVSAENAVLIDSLTGKVLYEKDKDSIKAMASTTKIMTAIIALENLKLDEIIEIKAEYTGIEGSSMYLKTGDKVTVETLLYGLLLNSGNDAATALAGETHGFIELMNEKASELNLQNTSFSNPSGLDDENHYTTAYELALIARYAMQNIFFRKIVGTKSIDDPSYMANHNKMLSLYENSTGIKTGYTSLAGRCLVSSAMKNDREIIAVTLNAPDDWNDHIAMLDYGFSLYSETTLHSKGDIYAEIDVYGGVEDKVSVMYLKDKNYSILSDEMVEYKIFAKKINYAPIQIGDTYGIIEYYIDGNCIASDYLVYTKNINLQEEKQSFWDKLLSFV